MTNPPSVFLGSVDISDNLERIRLSNKFQLKISPSILSNTNFDWRRSAALIGQKRERRIYRQALLLRLEIERDKRGDTVRSHRMFQANQDPKMMTEEEREAYFQRDESLSVSKFIEQ